jgi:hypothetical protein
LQRAFYLGAAERYGNNPYAEQVNMNLPTKSAKGKSSLSFRLIHKGY